MPRLALAGCPQWGLSSVLGARKGARTPMSLSAKSYGCPDLFLTYFSLNESGPFILSQVSKIIICTMLKPHAQCFTAKEYRKDQRKNY